MIVKELIYQLQNYCHEDDEVLISIYKDGSDILLLKDYALSSIEAQGADDVWLLDVYLRTVK